MRIEVNYQSLKDLERDYRSAGPRFYREGKKLLVDTARDGKDTAKRIAKVTSGRHAKRYSNTFSSDRSAQAFVGFGGGEIKASYGPEPIGQGLLAPILENGSIHNPAHNNLAQSQDIIRPGFYRGVDALIDGLFQPDGDA